MLPQGGGDTAFRVPTALVLGIALVLVCSSLAAAQISVMISQHSNAHRRALASFLQAIDKSDPRIHGGPVLFTYDLGGQAEIGIEVAREIQRSGSDLVLAIGTTAALAAKREIKDIPIVFCMVLNPVSSGLVQNTRSPGGNITGSSLDIPLEVQFKYIKLLVTNLASIGVMHNPEETGILVREAAKVAESMNLLLIAKAISSERDVPDALGDLLNKIDVLWSVADSMVFGSQSAEYILLNTLRTGTPFIGLSPYFVRAGALMALSCDYSDIGAQAAEIANRVLNGENPGDIPITTPRKVSLWINLRTADQIGLHVPDSVVKLADQVIR
jgi:putative ABC transport system substrate-binding protein